MPSPTRPERPRAADGFRLNDLTASGEVAAAPSQGGGAAMRTEFAISALLADGSRAELPVVAEGPLAIEAALLQRGERVLVSGPLRTSWRNRRGGGEEGTVALLAETLLPMPRGGRDVNWWQAAGAAYGPPMLTYGDGEARGEMFVLTRTERVHNEWTPCALRGKTAEDCAVTARAGAGAWASGRLSRAPAPGGGSRWVLDASGTVLVETAARAGER